MLIAWIDCLQNRAGFTPSGAPVHKKCGGPYYEYPPYCLHTTRTVVIIDILLRTRSATHTTIAAAAFCQLEATQNRFLYSLIIISIFLACYHVAKNEINCAFVGAPVQPNMLNMPKSASARKPPVICHVGH